MMSSPQQMERMCHSKRCYLDETTARIEAQKRMDAGEPHKLSVYKCPVCKFWHMTKRPPL